MMLKDIRVAKGITQQEVANSTFLSLNVISRMENGKTVRKSSFLRVCQALGVRPEEVEGVATTRIGPKSA